MTNLRWLSLLLSLSIILSPALAAGAQQKRRIESPPPASAAVAKPAPTPAAPVASSRQPDEDAPKSGYVQVRVTKNDYNNITERIGLAPNGLTFIEFPANDPLYAVHEGNENFAKVDKGDKDKGEPKPTDALVIRPGKGFSVPPKDSGEPPPSTIITVQRVSGVVVSFEIVPVAKASQNANRVVVTYDTNAVIEARRLAGLATNLVPDSELEKLGVQPPASAARQPNGQQLAASLPSDSDGGTTGGDEVAPTPANAPALSVEERTIAELRRVGTSNQPLKYGKAIHGIALAVAPNKTRTADVVIEVVAVRNTLAEPIRLVADQPDVFIESRTEKGSGATLGGRVPVLHVATTLGDDDVLQPGVTYYFAFAYTAPVLGAKQTLRVVMAQMNASDEPASADLVASAR
jgi:hypothetical protein